ncbi:UDP-N-acetylglucosamine 1-carboxyvinyltransferase [Candidatus Uhrbacteria bacterium]|nr:UDP-N-acetylglucosamine 1-carboxyvinyltransferase [Candidatus Uhrbacteria bacterium]
MKQTSYQVRGGVTLQGSVDIPGAKNAASKEIVASLMADDVVYLSNVPRIGEIDLTIKLAEDVGARIRRRGTKLEIDPRTMTTSQVSTSFSRKNRIPILLLGPLLHRFGEAVIPALGGDAIGARPINFHLEALQKMGAEIIHDGETYIAKATRLHGQVIQLPYPSVGATENVMLAAVKAKGTTVICNAAVEPEVVDLAMLLQSMGAIIHQDVNRKWIIEGVESLHGATHRIIPDRLVAASFAVAAAITGGDVFVKDARQVDLLSFLNVFRRLGIKYEIQEDGIRFFGHTDLKPIAIETDVHPGFMTDWQQPLVVMLTQANGVSIVHETVYEDRFGYTDALKKMGAKIQLHHECLGSKPCRFVNRDYRHSAIIVGPTKLKAAHIVVPDIRAGFSYLLAALISNGTSILTGVDHLERGYEDLIGKMNSLGANIQVKTI